MERLAIIGSGIAGMGAAHFLKQNFDITIFEKANYIGGHTNTVYVEENNQQVPIDTGFMVFNRITYPNLLRLFRQLDVPIQKTCMSFSVRDSKANLEYCGTGLNGLFRQRRNLFNARFIRMLLSINRFNQDAPAVLSSPAYENVTIGEFVEQKGYGADFLNKYLVPMSGAVWSTPPEKMLEFPAKTLIRFFYNHGFLGLSTQHQWYTPTGGSEEYKKRLIAPFRDRIRLNEKIESVSITSGKPQINFKNGSWEIFDKVLFACHGDQALKLIHNPSAKQKELLGAFTYQYNHVYLHKDKKVMPKIKGVWSSWNYRMEVEREKIKAPTTIYWMNRLQNLKSRNNYFVSLNDPNMVRDRYIVKEIHYEHPLFDQAAITAQSSLPELNENSSPLYFCGSYFRYGFHEDALTAAVDVSKQLLRREPW